MDLHLTGLDVTGSEVLLRFKVGRPGCALNSDLIPPYVAEALRRWLGPEPAGSAESRLREVRSQVVRAQRLAVDGDRDDEAAMLARVLQALGPEPEAPKRRGELEPAHTADGRSLRLEPIDAHVAFAGTAEYYRGHLLDVHHAEVSSASPDDLEDLASRDATQLAAWHRRLHGAD